jgi:drug/metabolite transporter (DMT)-like permease
MTAAAAVVPTRAEGGYGILALAVLCISVGSIFVRLASAPPLAVAFYRIGLATLILAPFAIRAAAKALPSLSARHRLIVAASGIALGLHFATWIASLSYTTVAASVLLVNTAPLFTLAFSRLILGETVARSVAIAMAVALAGAVCIAAGDWSGGTGSLTGAALAVAGAVTLSAYHVIGRGLRDALPLAAYVLCVWAAAALTLGALVLAFGVPLTGYPARTFGWMLGLAAIPTVLGHGLVNLSLRAFPAPTVGLFLLGEPVAATALALAVFGERPGPLTIAGGVLVVAALAVVARGESA